MFLAQFNLAWMKFGFDESVFDPFRAELEAVHQAAEAAPGFVWRYVGEADKGGFIQPFREQPRVMGNLSVWRDYQSLFDFTFRDDGHMAVMNKKREWFEPPGDRVYSVMWWTKKPEVTIVNAVSRVQLVEDHGDGPLAFSFRNPHLDEITWDHYESFMDLLSQHKKT